MSSKYISNNPSLNLNSKTNKSKACNCSTSGYSSQSLSECDYMTTYNQQNVNQQQQDSLSFKSTNFSSSSPSQASQSSTQNKNQLLLTINSLLLQIEDDKPSNICTSTPTQTRNLASTIGSSLSTINSFPISKPSQPNSNFIYYENKPLNQNLKSKTKPFYSNFVNFFISLFTCFNFFKCEKKNDSPKLSQSSIEANFRTEDTNLPKILLKNRANIKTESSFMYPKRCDEIQTNNFPKASTPIKSTYPAHLTYIDEKETYDNLPINESTGLDSFNRARYTINGYTANTAESSRISQDAEQINPPPLLSSSPYHLPIRPSFKSIRVDNSSSSSSDNSSESEETNYDNELEIIANTNPIFYSNESSTNSNSNSNYFMHTPLSSLGSASIVSNSTSISSSPRSFKKASVLKYTQSYSSNNNNQPISLIYSNSFGASSSRQLSNQSNFSNYYCLSLINLNQENRKNFRKVPIYDDYLCDKEVESYFENPNYFDCFLNEDKIEMVNAAPAPLKHNSYSNQNNFKSSSVSTSSGVVSGSNISTLSSIRSIKSIIDYGGQIRQLKAESYC